jgi:RNA recognition motif-containing protein
MDSDINMNQNAASDSPRERERDRGRRGEKGNRFAKNDRDRSREKGECSRIYVSNVSYDYRWQDLKDLFRREVGDVEFVELFNDENNKPRGCGIIEFKKPESVQVAMDKMNKYDLNGRQLVIKEDYGNERDKYGRVVRNSGPNNNNRRDNRDDDRMPNRGNLGGGNLGGGGGGGNYNDYDGGSFNTYGLSTSFLQGLGINGPLHTKVFVANLDYKVTSKKLKEVFKLAGRIQSLDLSTDKDGNSRGFAVVEYDHPVEAVQAISMFNQQMLFDRRMTVRLDRIPEKGEATKLPEGLRGIGIGLGPNGEPLKDISRFLSNTQQNTNQNSQAGSGSSNVLSALQNSNLQGLKSNLTSNLAALTGALSNPLLSSAANLSNLGVGLSPANDLTSANSLQSFNNPGNSFGNGMSGLGVTNSSRDFDLGGSSVRNYNTSSNDFGRGYGGGINNGSIRSSDTILIKNLPPSCTWQTLRDKLRDVGEVTFAEIRGQDNGVVRFAKERDAELAIKILNGSRFEGRTVEVSLF